MSAPRLDDVDGPFAAAVSCTVVAVVAAVHGVRGLLADLGGGLADGLAALGWLAVVLLAVAAFGWWRGRTERAAVRLGAMRVHVDTHGQQGPASSRQRFIGRHEWGHVRGAVRQGMGVERIEIGDGYGYVRAKRFVSVQASITFLAAGHLAVGSKAGASADLANIRRLARLLPADTRKAELRDAIARARSIVARDAGIIRREGHALADRGRA